MAKIFELDAIGFSQSERDTTTQALGATITFLNDDAQIQNLFAANADGIATIQVADFNSYPNSKVNWLNISRSRLNLIKFFFFFDSSYYFVISKSKYDHMKTEAQDSSNTVAVRLGKVSSEIVIYITFGFYEDFSGGGTDGLLHGARIPPAP